MTSEPRAASRWRAFVNACVASQADELRYGVCFTPSFASLASDFDGALQSRHRASCPRRTSDLDSRIPLPADQCRRLDQLRLRHADKNRSCGMARLAACSFAAAAEPARQQQTPFGPTASRSSQCQVAVPGRGQTRRPASPPAENPGHGGVRADRHRHYRNRSRVADAHQRMGIADRLNASGAGIRRRGSFHRRRKPVANRGFLSGIRRRVSQSGMYNTS